MSLSFHTQTISFDLKQKRLIRTWVKAIADSEKKHLGDIAWIFCSDDELLDINIRHLNHNTYTDIITFDYTADNFIAGDIFISVERVKENAEKFNVTFEEELHRVMIHGVLHLCGYKDKSREQSELMRKKENNALKKLAALA